MFLEYNDQVHNLTIYARKAHAYDNDKPKTYSYEAAVIPIAQPNTYEARVENARKVIEEADIVMPVFIDEIDNPMWCIYGHQANNFIGSLGIACGWK